jgi:hypothetical protein
MMGSRKGVDDNHDGLEGWFFGVRGLLDLYVFLFYIPDDLDEDRG